MSNKIYFWPIFYWYELKGCGRCYPEKGGCANSLNDRCADEIELNKPINYNILETDYDTYSIVYRCQESYGGWAIKEQMWVLTRETELDPSLWEEIKGKIDSWFPNYIRALNLVEPRIGDSCNYQ